jgi:hypothetical protein
LIIFSLINIFLIQDMGDSFRFQIDRAWPFAGRLYDEAATAADFGLSQASLQKIFEMNEAIDAVVGLEEGKASISVHCLDGSETTIEQFGLLIKKDRTRRPVEKDARAWRKGLSIVALRTVVLMMKSLIRLTSVALSHLQWAHRELRVYSKVSGRMIATPISNREMSLVWVRRHVTPPTHSTNRRSPDSISVASASTASADLSQSDNSLGVNATYAHSSIAPCDGQCGVP